MWALAAFAIAAVALIASLRLKGAARTTGIVAMSAVVLLGSLPLIGPYYVESHKNSPTVYQVRTIILDAKRK